MKRRRVWALALCLALACATLAAPAAAEEAVYRSLYSGEVTTLNYLIATATNDHAVAAQTQDTLIEYDAYGQVSPALAKSWEVSEDGLTWTFHLREDAVWVTAAGEEYAKVTAHDFVTSAEYILNAQNASGTAANLYGFIAGAKAYFDGTSTPAEGEEPAPAVGFDTVGVKAADDYTLVYTLSDPCPYFLSMLDYVSFMPVNAQFLAEKGTEFGLATGSDTLLYCGAYRLAEFKPQEKRVYVKNDKYWDAGKIYITTLSQQYNAEASTISPEMYLRGEIDEASIDAALASDWLADPEKAETIHPRRQFGRYSYFYAFNFNPQFDAAYEPENWKKAVNNENFRLSLFHGLNRLKALSAIAPDNPAELMFNTITPPTVVMYEGVDYTTMGDLAAISARESFNEEMALAYKEKAVEELTAAGATFPVKILMPYNPATAGWDEECQIVEQQLEELLGGDYIDIIVEAGPSSGFLKAVRHTGQYAFMKCNWGLDFADPCNLIPASGSPLGPDNTYNDFELLEDAALLDEYVKLATDADAIKVDLKARYEAFTKAEALLINHAIVVPIGYGSGGYTASRLNPFEAQYAPFGLSELRYKGQHLLDKPMNTDEYYDAYDAWLDARANLGAD